MGLQTFFKNAEGNKIGGEYCEINFRHKHKIPAKSCGMMTITIIPLISFKMNKQKFMAT